MAVINKIHGSSLLTTSINVPIEFGTKVLNTENQTLIVDDNYKIVIDENDISSIIEFKTIPYIDYRKYDYERRRWYTVDKYESLWRIYTKDEYVLETKTKHTAEYDIYFSMENLFKYKFSDHMTNQANSTTSEYILDLNITKYQPITLTIEGVEYTDITDYSFNVAPKLDYIVPESNHQFYIKNNRIYTNTDLTSYDDADIDIRYFYNISDIKVHNIMHTNSANYSNYTPVVDYYLVKLTGQ